MVVLLAGGLVVGAGMPSLAATLLGRKPGASSGSGVSLPLAPRPGEGGGSSSTPGANDGEVIALGRKPGASAGIGLGSKPGGAGDPWLVVPLGTRRGAGIASGSNHIGEEIPQ